VFAYILRGPALGDVEPAQSAEFFKRFAETPGLLHAFELEREDDPADILVVAVWTDREAAQRYIEGSALRREIDEAVPGITRTMYAVRDVVTGPG
jgi:quinol monooxygenase YgiN